MPNGSPHHGSSVHKLRTAVFSCCVFPVWRMRRERGPALSSILALRGYFGRRGHARKARVLPGTAGYPHPTSSPYARPGYPPRLTLRKARVPSPYARPGYPHPRYSGGTAGYPHPTSSPYILTLRKASVSSPYARPGYYPVQWRYCRVSSPYMNTAVTRLTIPAVAFLPVDRRIQWSSADSVARPR